MIHTRTIYYFNKIIFFNIKYYVFIVLILSLLHIHNGEIFCNTIISTGRGQQVQCNRPCVPISQCTRAMELLKNNGTRPQICNFIDFEPQICCPSLYSNDYQEHLMSRRISEKKCSEFYPSTLPDGAFGAVAAFETEPDEFPFMAAIGYGSIRNPTYNCGGFLTEKNFVITAGHCAKYNGVPPSVVRIGGNPLSDEGTKPIPVVKVVVHPNYQSATELNDIAILILGQRVEQTPACLWNFGKIESESNVISVGYGSTSFGGAFARRLLKVYLTVIDNKVCEESYKNQPIVNSQLCVLGKTRHLNGTEIAIQDTCQGDSGGPLILEGGYASGPRIVGVVSYGQGCGTRIPGIYTNISSHIDWIESIIWPSNNGEEKFVIA